MTDLGLPVLVLLGVVGLVGGVGITALGPGGVLPTIGLFTLTNLSPAEVAGTAICTHVATGVLGTAAYARSGQLRDPNTLRSALILAGTALIGTSLGVSINTAVSERAFALVLAGGVALIAVLVWCREHRPIERPRGEIPMVWLLMLGLVVSTASGVVGVGGPMLSVPLLIVVGAPVLQSLAAAQVQSIVIAGVGTVGYLAHGAIDWPLAALVGLPELAGVLLGWKIAQAVPGPQLRYAMIVTLLALAPYLALQG